MSVLAKFYGDGLLYPAVIGEGYEEGHFVQFVGFEDDGWQRTLFKDIFIDQKALSPVVIKESANAKSLKSDAINPITSQKASATQKSSVAKELRPSFITKGPAQPQSPAMDTAHQPRKALSTPGTSAAAPRAVNKNLVVGIAQIVRDGLVVNNRYVSLTAVVKSTVEQLGVSKFEELGVGAVRDIEYLRQLAELEDYVNTFINCFFLKTCICTLHDLNLRLAESRGVKTFEDLKLGPLLKHPVVMREFQPSPHVVAIPCITALDCARALLEVMKKRTSRTSSIEPKAIIDVIMAERRVADPHELCVRIKGIGLYITHLANCGWAESGNLRDIKNKIENEEKERLAEMEKKMRAKLDAQFQRLYSAGPLDDGKFQAFLNGEMSEDDMMIYGQPLLNLFRANLKGLAPLLESDKLEAMKARTKRARPHESIDLTKGAKDPHMSRLATFLRDTPLGRAFASIVCDVKSGCKASLTSELEKERSVLLESRLARDLKVKDVSETADHCRSVSNGQAVPALKDVPPKSAVVERVRNLLKKLPNAKSLRCLHELEQDVAREFKSENFEALGHGGFLKFVCDEPQLLDCLDNKLATSANMMDSSDAWEVLLQAQRVVSTLPNWSDDARQSFVKSALAGHFDMDRKAVEPLFNRMQSLQSNETAEPSSTSVLYSSVILAGEAEAISFIRIDDSVKATHAALKLLGGAPFLVDLASWTQWDAVFEPLLGKLSQFLVLHPEHGVSILKLPHGRLVRLNALSSPDTFRNAILSRDPVKTAVEIVSVISLHDGTLGSPNALLEANAAAGFGTIILQVGEEQAADFVVQTARAVPPVFRRLLVNRFLVNPFAAALGQGHGHCYEIVMRKAKHDSELRSIFTSLGICHGVPSWTSEWVTSLFENPMAESCDENKQDIAQRTGEQRAKPLDDKGSTIEWRLTPFSPGKDVLSTSEVLDSTRSDNVRGEGHSLVRPEVGEDSQRAAQSIIAEIRLKEFGIGLDLDGEGAGLRESLNARVGRALQRLSSELYSSDSHFLLELIQNADDNSYPDMVTPQLLFVKSSRYILVANNECGFTERDIRALCDIGKSTKLKRTGYIGQKGIGFKSVFRVTDAPQIHSNGFSVVFDTKAHGPLGFILPEWTNEDSLRELLEHDGELLSQLRHWPTVIALPLKETCQNVASLFEDVSPSLLLFLKQLRRLSVVDPSSNSQLVFERQELGEGVVQVSRNEQCTRYLTVTKSIKPEVLRLDVEVEATDVTVAIPLLEHDDCIVQQQCVFAYLPIRPFGFRFIVQGDFILPSSREAIDRDSPWNQRLRAEIPEAFALAVEASIKLHPDHPVKSANLWLSVLPFEAEVEGFFQPCVRAIHALVKSKDCVLTSNLDWVVPSKVLICRSKFTGIVDAETLQRFLNLHLAHKDLFRKPLVALGVSEVGIGTIMDLLVAGAYNTPQQLSQILIFFADLMANHQLSAEDLRKLGSLPILVLNDGKITSIEDGPVYFDHTATSGDSVGKAAASASLSLSTFLRILDPLLEKQTNDHEAQLVRRLLRQIGVKDMKLDEIVRHHVIAEFSKPTALQTSESLLVSLLSFSCCFWLESRKLHKNNDDIFSDLKQCAILSTNKGFLRLSSAPALHFTPDYENPIELFLMQHMIGLDWTFVTGKYLDSSQIPAKDWRQFLQTFGVQDFVSVIPRQLRIDATLESEWRSFFIESGHKIAGDEFVIEDFHSPELEDVFHSSENSSDRCRLMHCVSQYFARAWNSVQIITQTKARVIGMNLDVPSSFLQTLMKAQWLPNAQKTGCFRPSDLWLRCNAVKSVFGALPIQYALAENIGCVEGHGTESFFEAIGVKVKPTEDTVLQELLRWSETSTFSADLSDVAKVYSYLASRFEASTTDLIPSQLRERPTYTRKIEIEARIRESFNQYRLVFLPFKGDDKLRDAEAPQGKVIKGAFYPLSDLRFFDESRIIESCTSSPLRILAPYYRRTETFIPQRFFMTNLRGTEREAVPEHPSFEDYLSVLHLVAESPCKVEQLNQCNAVFELWYNELERETIPPGEWQSRLSVLRNRQVFPTTTGSWTTLRPGVYISDDEELQPCFESTADLNAVFLNLGPQEKQASSVLRRFYQVCGVPLLSQSVERRPITNGSYFGSKLSALVRDLFPLIQRWIFWKLPKSYDAVARHVEPRLAVFNTILCDSIELHVELNGIRIAPPKQCSTAMDGTNLFVTRDAALKYNLVCGELSRFFFEGTLNDEFTTFAFMTMSLLALDPDSVEPRMEKAGCLRITDSLVEWKVRLVSEVLNSIDSERHTMSADVPIEPTQSAAAKKRGPVAPWPPPLSSQMDADGPSSFRQHQGSESQQANSLTTSGSVVSSLPARPPVPGGGEPARPRTERTDGTLGDTDVGVRDGVMRSGRDSSGANLELESISGSVEAKSSGEKLSQRVPSEQRDVADGVSAATNSVLGAQSADRQRASRSHEAVEGSSDGPSASQPPTSHDASVDYSAVPLDRFDPVAAEAARAAETGGSIDEFDVVDAAEGLSHEECSDESPLARAVARCLLDPVAAKNIGRYGEALVVAYLRRVMQKNLLQVEWVNEAGESGACFDICTRLLDETGKVVRTDYIEVKTTGNQSKSNFEVSHGELRMAEEHGEHFHFFRVILPAGHSGAQEATRGAAAADGGDSERAGARLVRVTNPVALWRRGVIAVAVVM